MVVFLLMGYGHTVARFFNWTRVEHVLGIGFIIVKVALLLALEVAIFPTLSGWWIDICSLKLCDSTLADRINYLYTAPGTTTFLHWLVMTLSNVILWCKYFFSLLHIRINNFKFHFHYHRVLLRSGWYLCSISLLLFFSSDKS